MANVISPPGAVFVCNACGKRSRDLYGKQKISLGWDESCMLNAILCEEKSLFIEGDTVLSGTTWVENLTKE